MAPGRHLIGFRLLHPADCGGLQILGICVRDPISRTAFFSFKLSSLNFELHSTSGSKFHICGPIFGSGFYEGIFQIWFGSGLFPDWFSVEWLGHRFSS
jgi:hypothetical protein